MNGSLSVSAISSRDKLLSEMEKAWQAGATLVLPSRQARRQWISRVGTVSGKKRLFVFSEFWGQLASAGEVPEVRGLSETRVIVRREAGEFASLGPLVESPGGVDLLLASLEAQVVWDLPFSPAGQIGKDLASLQKRLEKLGALASQRRAALARLASDVSFASSLLFVHPPEMDSQVRQMLLALSEQNQVALLFLGGEALLQDMEGLPQPETEGIVPEGRWVRAEDPRSYAAGEAMRLVREEGARPSDIAIVDFSSDRSFESRAEEAGLPLWSLQYVKAEDTKIGRFLLEGEDYPPFCWKEEWADMPLLEAGRLAFAEAFALLGDRERLETGRVLHSFESLLGKTDEDEKILLADLVTDPFASGQREGARFIKPQELLGTFFPHVIAFGLGAEDLPRPKEKDPFLGHLPRQSEEAAWQAAMLFAGPGATFVLEEGDPGSPFWRKDSGEEQDVSSAPIPRKEALLLAEEGSWPGLRAMSERSAVEGRQGGRDSFSVSELESYLRCPYGWYAQYVIRPRSPESAAQRLGNVAHNVLARMFEFPEEEREMALAAIFEDRDFALSGWEKEVLPGRIWKVMETYSGEWWPFSETYAEYKMSMSVPDTDSGEEITIYGKADRVDTRESEGAREVLVLDYKTGSLPKEEYRLQPFLYPQMAAAQFDAAPLGFLYVSVASAESDGYLSRPMDLFPHVLPSWQSKKSKATSRARAAITGIRSGRWSETGQNCPSWCAHRLLEGGQ